MTTNSRSSSPFRIWRTRSRVPLTKVSTGVLSNVKSGTKRGWGPVYGGGVGFDFTPSSGVVLEWQRHEFRYPGAGGRQDVDNTSVGYVYRF